MRAKQFGRMDMVEEHPVANLDALPQAHDVERSWSSEDRAIPAERARPAQHVERSLKGRRPGAVIDDMHAFATGQTQRLLGEPPLGLDCNMAGARLVGRSDLLLQRDAPDDMTAP